MPPNKAATSKIAANGGTCLVALRFPNNPDIELTKMNMAETANAVFADAQRIQSRRGVKKIPPPVPVSPDSKPIHPPTDNVIGKIGSVETVSSVGLIKNRIADKSSVTPKIKKN